MSNADKLRNLTALINDPYLKGAFEDVRQKYLAAFESAPIDDDTGPALVELRKMLKALEDVKQSLNDALHDAEFEELPRPASEEDYHGRGSLN